MGPSIPRDQGVDETRFMGHNVPAGSSWYQRRWAMAPCDPTAWTGFMGRMPRNQGSDTSGGPRSAARQGGDIAGQLDARAHLIDWPPADHDAGLLPDPWQLDLLARWAAREPGSRVIESRRPDERTCAGTCGDRRDRGRGLPTSGPRRPTKIPTQPRIPASPDGGKVRIPKKFGSTPLT